MTQMLKDREAMPYGTALYEQNIAREDIEWSREIIRSTPQLLKALTCPVIPMKEKLACIDKIFPESMRNFIKVVCNHGKCGLLDMIFSCYEKYADKMENVLRATLRCVTPPKPDQLLGIKKFLADRFEAHEVVIDIVNEPSLMGGFVIEAGGCEFDYSIRSRFHQLEQKLIRR